MSMKPTILLLCLICLASGVVQAQKYKHKSETEIAAMTPAQRVDEWVNEQVHHRFDLSDDQGALIRKYVTLDGIKAMPRLIEIIDEYDPTKFREGKGKRGDRFDACSLMLGYIDDFGVRLRSAEEGRRSINALEQSIERMRKAGYGQPDQDDWEKHARFDSNSRFGIIPTEFCIREPFFGRDPPLFQTPEPETNFSLIPIICSWFSVPARRLETICHNLVEFGQPKTPGSSIKLKRSLNSDIRARNYVQSCNPDSLAY
jgi:hypothetical protein